MNLKYYNNIGDLYICNSCGRSTMGFIVRAYNGGSMINPVLVTNIVFLFFVGIIFFTKEIITLLTIIMYLIDFIFASWLFFHIMDSLSIFDFIRNDILKIKENEKAMSANKLESFIF